MFWDWAAIIAGFVATGVIGYCTRALIGDRREDRAYDEGWSDREEEYARDDLLARIDKPPSPASSSPSSSSSPPVTFALATAPSSPATASPSALPVPLRRPWRWDELSGTWAAQEPLENTFARALLTVPLDGIPALFGATPHTKEIKENGTHRSHAGSQPGLIHRPPVLA